MRKAVLALLIPTACTSGTDPDVDADGWRRVMGTMEPAMSSVQAIKVPADIVAGVPFTVTLTTLGSSSCTRADGANRAVVGNMAVITPYDRIAPEGTGCTRDLRGFPRDVTITIAEAGPATIRIIARGIESPVLTYDATVTVRSP